MKSRKEVSLQKGSLLVLVAVLLPILFACAGLARDLGSIYSYKSNLQNAVDSAALVGASAYMRNDETAGSHPEADSRADDYLKANLGSGYTGLKGKSFQAQKVSGKRIIVS